MMVEYGELFWRDGWGSLYSVFGGNPLAAMPSLHFATSVMAALLLAEVGPLAGALGFSYAPCSGSRSCTSASTTWSICSRARRSPVPCGVSSDPPERWLRGWGAPSRPWRR